MKGRNPYTKPRMTAPLLYSSGNGSRISPRDCNTEFTIPVSRRMNIHAYVRIRKLVQKGRITSPRYRFLRAPERAMNSARGNPRIRQSAVATAEIQSERKMIAAYTGSHRRV